MSKLELKRKIQDLTYKINKIKGYGGIVPDSMQSELKQAVNMKKNLNSKLEKQFKESVEIANRLIEEKLKEASNKIEEAVHIAEQYGICFRLKLPCLEGNQEDDLSEMVRSTYIPKTYKKWKEFLCENWEFEELMTGAPNYVDEGWEHSRIC